MTSNKNLNKITFPYFQNKVCATGERCGFDGVEAKCMSISSSPETRRSNTNRLGRLSRTLRTKLWTRTSGLARTARTRGANHRGQAKPHSNCNQHGDRGRCLIPKLPIERYYFSQRQGKCVRFAYSGCGGNSNNFKTYKHCFDECVQPKVSSTDQKSRSKVASPQRTAVLSSGQNRRILQDAAKGNIGGSLLLAPVPGQNLAQRQCFMPLEKGKCQGIQSWRWHFNPRSGSCEDFRYTGCGGNANNFMGKDECEATCKFNSQSVPGPAGRWSDSAASVEFPPFCQQLPDRGTCRGRVVQYFYNKDTRSCEPFNYSGCGGNQNRFLSEKECHQFCAVEGALTNPESSLAKVPQPPPVAKISHAELAQRLPEHCYLAEDSGPCFAALPRYYYDKVTKKCEPFIYGGCQGNGNQFKNIELCESECVHPAKPAAKEPTKQKQPPKNASSKLTHAKNGGKSESTKSSGSTSTISQDAVFLSIPDLCYLPAQTGCNNKLTRFYYNIQTRKCESFEYGGCRPNENNFVSAVDCERTCMNPTSGQMLGSH